MASNPQNIGNWRWALLFLGSSVLFQANGVQSVIPPANEEPRCTGLSFDISRLKEVKANQNGETGIINDESTSYSVKGVSPVRLPPSGKESTPCLGQTIRVQQRKNGVPIYGSSLVGTVSDCSITESAESEEIAAEKTKMLIESVGLDQVNFSHLTGKKIESIKSENGYDPVHSAQTVTSFLIGEYGISSKDSDFNVGTPKLYIFPSTEADYLVYFTNVITTDNNDNAVLLQVVVDATDLKILRTCVLSKSPEAQQRKRRLRNGGGDKHRQLQVSCTTCAQDRTLTSIGTVESSQQINSLYLNDTGRTTTVRTATTSTGSSIFVPEANDAYYWEGTYNCFSSSTTCRMVELPTCPDAMSDVQYVAIETMKYTQEKLDVLGGLAVSNTNIQPVTGYVHYRRNYCNAFYTSNTITFGDCDCIDWSPLTTIDVVAHELGHGYTDYSSELIYDGQSGGLNEAYSDILGTLLEFHINDSNDTPDFLIGEQMEGSYGILRYMEDPPLDGVSLGTICDYNNFVDVHYSSGILNKAFVKAIRACEASSCSGTTAECVDVVGRLFFYTNLNRLTEASTFREAAENTCDVIDTFFSTLSPTTSCTVGEVRSFVVDGFASVDLIVDSSNCTAIEDCDSPVPGPPPTPAPVPTIDPSEGCANATSLPLPSKVTDSTIGDPFYDSVSCGFATSRDSPGDWYSVVGSGEQIIASLCETTSGDTQLSVWTGPCNNLRCVGGNDDFCGLQAQVAFQSVSGQTYLIYVYSYGGGTLSSYTLSVEENVAAPTPAPTPAAPPADPSAGCAIATPLTVDSRTNAVTRGATIYAAESCGGATSTNSAGLWYSVVGTGGQLEASTCTQADFDTQLSVWSGDCSNLMCVGGSDDSCGLRSRVSWFAAASETYLIFVYGYGGASGSVILDVNTTTTPAPTPTPAPVTPPPTEAVLSMEDGCSAATTLAIGSTTSSSTVGEALYQSEQCEGAYPLRSRGTWYKVTGDGSNLLASLCQNSNYDTMMSIWTGPCSALTCVGGSDDSCGLRSAVDWDSISGTDYYIFVHGYGGDIGSFEINISQGSITSRPTPRPTTAPPTNPPTSSPPTSSIILSMEEGCAAATSIAVGSTESSFTVGAPRYQTSSCGVYSGVFSGLWYKVTGTGFDVTASTCGNSDYDTMLSVWKGPCSALTCVGGNDDFCSTQSELEWNAPNGDEYYIFVHGWSGRTGNFGLSISGTTLGPTPRPTTPRPTPSPTPRPTPIPSTSPTVESSDVVDACLGATRIAMNSVVSDSTIGRPYFNIDGCGDAPDTVSRGIVYAIEGDGGLVTASLCDGTDFDTMISVGLVQGSCASIDCVDGNDDACGIASEVTFQTSSNEIYLIYVHGYFGTTGSFQLSVTSDNSVQPTTLAPSPAPTTRQPSTPETPAPTESPDCGSFQAVFNRAVGFLGF